MSASIPAPESEGEAEEGGVVLPGPEPGYNHVNNGASVRTTTVGGADTLEQSGLSGAGDLSEGLEEVEKTQSSLGSSDSSESGGSSGEAEESRTTEGSPGADISSSSEESNSTQSASETGDSSIETDLLGPPDFTALSVSPETQNSAYHTVMPYGYPGQEGSQSVQLAWQELLESGALETITGNGEAQAEMTHPSLADMVMPSLPTGTEDNTHHLMHPAEEDPQSIWSSPDDPHQLQPLQPIMSNLSHDTNDSNSAPEHGDQSPELMVVGDVNSGETLPSEPELFGDLSSVGYQSPGAQMAPYMHHGIHEQHHHMSLYNFSAESFFSFWRGMWLHSKPGYPQISNLADGDNVSSRPSKITPKEIQNKDMDMQGIHWSWFGTTKAKAREVRKMTYRNFVNMRPPVEQRWDDWSTPRYKVNYHSPSAPALPATEAYFRFRETNTKHVPTLRHYQLRHNIFATSQNAVYYHRGGAIGFPIDTEFYSSSDNEWSVECYSPITGNSTPVMTRQKGRPDASFLTSESTSHLGAISTLSASHDILVVGSIYGIYGLRSLLTAPSSPHTVGLIAPIPASPHSDSNVDKSTNHVHVHLSRQSASPLAIFNSNDHYIRVLDCTTATWLSQHRFHAPVNCSTTSPDARLRLLVCDDATPIIADAESGEILHSLPGHTDHGFSCAWAPDGVTVATGHQDGIVQAFDIRSPRAPIARIPSEQSCVRAMQFSPLGGGKPVLVLAEHGDFVHVVDADTFGSKQTIEFLGDIAGVSMTPDGRSLFVGNCDEAWGGMMEFERAGNVGSPYSWTLPKKRLNAVRADLTDVLDAVYGGEDSTLKTDVQESWQRRELDWGPEAEVLDRVPGAGGGVGDLGLEEWWW